MLRKHHIDPVLLNAYPVFMFAFHNLSWFVSETFFNVLEIQFSLMQILRCCKMLMFLVSTFYVRFLVTFWILEWLTGWDCVLWKLFLFSIVLLIAKVNLYSVDGSWKKWGVEWWWEGKSEVLGGKPFSVPLCPPEIPH